MASSSRDSSYPEQCSVCVAARIGIIRNLLLPYEGVSQCMLDGNANRLALLGIRFAARGDGQTYRYTARQFTCIRERSARLRPMTRFAGAARVFRSPPD